MNNSNAHSKGGILSPHDFGAFTVFKTVKTKNTAGCQWLMPIILATWEASIKKIVVRGQAKKKHLQDPWQCKKARYDDEHLSCKQ
jgi:hypothetical protein